MDWSVFQGGQKNLPFLENYKGVLPVLKKNIDNLNKIEKMLKAAAEITPVANILDNKFEIIFIEPLYGKRI